MISAVKDIGELLIRKRDISELNSLVENPKAGKYKHLLIIDFKHIDKTLKYMGISLEELSDAKIMRYLYRSGSSRGSDLTPTSKITVPEKTYNIKLLGWFRFVFNNEKNLDLDIDEKQLLNQINESLVENSDSILLELQERNGLLPKNELGVITIKIDEKYIGDIEVFKRILIGLEDLKDNLVGEKDKVCSVCGIRKPSVSGNVNTYKFYTKDKPGFITGGFDEKLSWRNFPVCQDCKLALETGREFIESNLRFRFVNGLSYFLIPKFLFGTDMVTEEVLDLFIDGPKKVSLAGDTVKRITADEKEILGLVKDEKDSLSVQFLFLRSSQGAERIQLLIEDVYPSMIGKIFEAKEATDKIWLDLNRKFNFGTLRTFFMKSESNKRDNDLDKYFLQLTDNIFRLRPLNKRFILQFIMKKIRHDFVNETDYYHWTVLDAVMSLTFLLKLNLIKFEEVKLMQTSRFEDYFAGLSSMMSTPTARGIFLLGVLTEMLLNKQYKERESKPFLKQLKGLRLTERDIKGLLPKVENKLLEYESFDQGKRSLAEEIASYLLTAGDNWALSMDEINFYFVAGMNLSNKIAEKLYEKNKEVV